MSMVTVVVSPKTKFPAVSDFMLVVDAIVMLATDVELKIELCPAVVIKLPEVEIRLVPSRAPCTLRPVAADVIVDDTTDIVNAVSDDKKTMLSDAVAVNKVDESSVTPTLVAVDWNKTLRAEVAVKLVVVEVMSTTLALEVNKKLFCSAVIVLLTNFMFVNPPLSAPENTKLLPALEIFGPDKTESAVLPVVKAHK